MNPILRNVLAVIGGWLIGSAINGSLVQLGYLIFPLEGVNPDDMDSLAEAMKNARAEHFIFPFLAHALGTLSGAIAAAAIAANRQMTLALVIGGLFLLGGIAVSFIIPSPTWFLILDLVVAYIPMGYLGGIIGGKLIRQ